MLPLDDLTRHAKGFNRKTPYELRVLTTSETGAAFDIFIDEIGFEIGVTMTNK